MNFGFNIAVLDKGFVYVGECVRHDDLLYITKCKNIIQWGTTEGLHQIVVDGPTKETKLSPAASIKVPWHAVISLHETREELWEKKKAKK
jgi:hypothetical protein